MHLTYQYPKIFLTIAVFFLCLFALNWAIASAYSGPGFYLYALTNGLLIGAVIVLVLKSYKRKN
jgi:hypothetical protein